MSCMSAGKLTPARIMSEANVWRLFRPRNSRHYAGFRTIPGELVFRPLGGSLVNIFPA